MSNPEIIVEQYRQIVGALDSMFLVARPRTKWDVWRFNGAGSCRDVVKEQSEVGLEGEAKEIIIYLREQRNQKYGGNSTVSECPYHRESIGCVLGDLKSPLCIAHFDADWEWKKNFGVDARSLKPEIEEVLSNILNAQTIEDSSLAETFIEKIEAIAEHIAQYPVADQTQKKYLKS